MIEAKLTTDKSEINSQLTMQGSTTELVSEASALLAGMLMGLSQTLKDTVTIDKLASTIMFSALKNIKPRNMTSVSFGKPTGMNMQ